MIFLKFVQSRHVYCLVCKSQLLTNMGNDGVEVYIYKAKLDIISTDARWITSPTVLDDVQSELAAVWLRSFLSPTTPWKLYLKLS